MYRAAGAKSQPNCWVNMRIVDQPCECCFLQGERIAWRAKKEWREGNPKTVGALLGRLSALRVSPSESLLHGAFVWPRRALNRRNWWFPARAVAEAAADGAGEGGRAGGGRAGGPAPAPQTLPLPLPAILCVVLCWSDDYTFCSSRGVEIKLYQNIFRAYETQRARTRAAAALFQR